MNGNHHDDYENAVNEGMSAWNVNVNINVSEKIRVAKCMVINEAYEDIVVMHKWGQWTQRPLTQQC